MSAFQSIVTAGIALGVLQLGAGAALGYWLAARRAPRGHRLNGNNRGDDYDEQRASRLAADLRGLTDSVAHSVRRHNAAIESIDHRLREETRGVAPEQAANPLTNLVVGVVGQMLGANQRLQQELGEAEDSLRRQTDELDQYRRDAFTDTLTGCPNRRALEDHLRTRLDGWRKHRAPFSVLMLDIDHFKRFNDTHGHQAGDAVLRAFGGAVAGALRKQDAVCRYGGEEFVALLPHATLQEACGASHKVMQAISNLRVDVGGQTLSVTASGGLASILADEKTSTLIARADQALYEAKAAGRDCVFKHDGEVAAPMESAPQRSTAVAGVGAVQPPSAEPSSAEPLAELPAELRDACDGLRTGMAEFLASTGAESGAS
ncbi:MAG: GGDEF domain-containing protein [Planctomycetota bacterium]